MALEIVLAADHLVLPPATIRMMILQAKLHLAQIFPAKNQVKLPALSSTCTKIIRKLINLFFFTCSYCKLGAAAFFRQIFIVNHKGSGSLHQFNSQGCVFTAKVAGKTWYFMHSEKIRLTNFLHSDAGRRIEGQA